MTLESSNIWHVFMCFQCSDWLNPQFWLHTSIPPIWGWCISFHGPKKNVLFSLFPWLCPWIHIYIFFYLCIDIDIYIYRNIFLKKNVISAGFIPSFKFPAGDGGPPREALLRPGLSRGPAVGPRAVPLRRWRLLWCGKWLIGSSINYS